jgi:hypothetical protein
VTDFPSGGDGFATSSDYVTASSPYACARGTRGMLELAFPKGQTLQGPLNVNLTCPCCGESVVIQGRSHYVDAAGVLVSV